MIYYSMVQLVVHRLHPARDHLQPGTEIICYFLTTVSETGLVSQVNQFRTLNPSPTARLKEIITDGDSNKSWLHCKLTV